MTLLKIITEMQPTLCSSNLSKTVTRLNATCVMDGKVGLLKKNTQRRKQDAFEMIEYCKI